MYSFHLLCIVYQANIEGENSFKRRAMVMIPVIISLCEEMCDPECTLQSGMLFKICCVYKCRCSKNITKQFHYLSLGSTQSM